MNTKPLVSIIIPVYNGEKYINEAIDSALAQTYDNCEIIVVNDGSTDATEEIALSYGSKIRYYAKENGGVSTALNLGIKHMSGEYIQYLPADDCLHITKIEKQIKAIINSGNEMSISWTRWNWYYSDINRIELRVKECPYAKEMYTKGIFPLLFSLLNSVTVLLNRKYIDLVGEFDETLYTSQDYDMWLRTFQDKETIYIDEPLVDYRIHEEQGTQADPEFIKNCIDMSKKLVSTMNKARIENMFGNEYRFVNYMIDFYVNAAWWECYEEMKQRLYILEEPADAQEQCTHLENQLKKQGQCREIVLYCAGKNGIRLLRNLKARGIEVSKFSDGDKSKYGTIIEGLECVSPDSLNKEKAHVIVTKDNPVAVVELLKQQGFIHIDTYENLGSKIHDTLPIKIETLKMLETIGAEGR